MSKVADHNVRSGYKIIIHSTTFMERGSMGGDGGGARREV
jgi:hypothetical protein